MSRHSISTPGGLSRPSSSLDVRNLSAADVAAELRSVIDLRRKNDELTGELGEVRSQLDAEKRRVRDAARERASAQKALRDQLEREREHLVEVTTQRVRKECRDKFDRGREKEKGREDDSVGRLLKRKDEELRSQRAAFNRERDDWVRRAVQECEERVRESVEQQAAQERVKLMTEMWALREQKMRTEQMLEVRIEAEHERVGDLRRREEEHEREVEELMRKSRSESVRDVQRIRLAERIVQSKDDDIAYFQQAVERLTLDNSKLTDEVTRLRVAEATDRKVARAVELSPKWRRRSDTPSVHGSTTSLNEFSPSSQSLTPRSLSPSTDRRDKPPSAMASKITRLEATIKTLEERITSLKQENATLARQQRKPTKSPGKLHAAARSASSNDVESSAAAADAKDENTTIRRLRKSNAELTTTVTQLKSKVRVLEGERDRAVRQEYGGTKLSRHESLSRPASRSSSRDKPSAGSRPVVAAAALTAVQKEKLKKVDTLEEENLKLVQHITRLTSEKMSMERHADLQLRSALQDVESTLSLRNAEIELLNNRLRRLEDKCRQLEVRQQEPQQQQRVLPYTPGAAITTASHSVDSYHVGAQANERYANQPYHHSSTTSTTTASSSIITASHGQGQAQFASWSSSATTGNIMEMFGAAAVAAQHKERQELTLSDFPATSTAMPVHGGNRRCSDSSGASTPQHPGNSPLVPRTRLSNPSTPVQMRAVFASSSTPAASAGSTTVPSADNMSYTGQHGHTSTAASSSAASTHSTAVYTGEGSMDVSATTPTMHRTSNGEAVLYHDRHTPAAMPSGVQVSTDAQLLYTSAGTSGESAALHSTSTALHHHTRHHTATGSADSADSAAANTAAATTPTSTGAVLQSGGGGGGDAEVEHIVHNMQVSYHGDHRDRMLSATTARAPPTADSGAGAAGGAGDAGEQLDYTTSSRQQQHEQQHQEEEGPSQPRNSSLENVISSLDSFKLSLLSNKLTTTTGTGCEDSGNAGSAAAAAAGGDAAGRNPAAATRSPHSFANTSAAGTATAATTSSSLSSSPSVLIAQATFTPPSASPSRQSHRTRAAVSEPRPSSLAPSPVSSSSIARSPATPSPERGSPFGRTKTSPRLASIRSTAHTNGFSSDTPDFDSDLVPVMSNPIALAMSSPSSTSAPTSTGSNTAAATTVLRMLSDAEESDTPSPPSPQASPIISTSGGSPRPVRNGIREFSKAVYNDESEDDAYDGETGGGEEDDHDDGDGGTLGERNGGDLLPVHGSGADDDDDDDSDWLNTSAAAGLV
eukprot:scpid70552/ scgid2514/ 